MSERDDARSRWACTSSTCSCARSRRSPRARAAQLVEEIRDHARRARPAARRSRSPSSAPRSAAPARSAPTRVGDMLLELLERDGVDTSLLVRRDDVQTSASVLPIRPNGDRPAFHVIGANATYGAGRRRRRTRSPRPTHLHLGGPEFMGGEAAARDPRARARAAASSPRPTSSRPATRAARVDRARPSRTSTTCCPTTSRCSGFTGADDLVAGCRALIERGVGCVAATRGADGARGRRRGRGGAGARLRDRGRRHDRLRRRLLGRLPARPLARPRPRATPRVLGCAAAALVAQGLGSDHGDFDLAAADAFAASAARLTLTASIPRMPKAWRAGHGTRAARARRSGPACSAWSCTGRWSCTWRRHPQGPGRPPRRVVAGGLGGHALAHQPLHFFQSNQFWPLHDTLAFSDALVGYAPAGLFGSGPHAAVFRYDVLFLFAYALAFAGAYLAGARARARVRRRRRSPGRRSRSRPSAWSRTATCR